MSKKILIIIFSLIVISSLFWYFNRDVDFESWESYQNSRYNFSLNYPKGWILGERETNNAGRVFYSPEKKVECYAYGFANSLLNEEGNSQTLDEFIDWFLENKELISKEEQKIDEEKAIYLLLKQDNNVWDAIYTLNKERGIGLYCIYENMETRNQSTNIFKEMKNSFKLDEEITFSGQDCTNLLNGLMEPLKDRQVFMDENYTEVTTISTENWDKERLPQKVNNLEDKNYTCYPIPFEYSDQLSGGGINAQPEVIKVKWSCELEYDQWYYLSQDQSTLLSSYRSEGFNCQKRECFSENGQIDFVWLCSK